jgi:hypothetical protein
MIRRIFGIGFLALASFLLLYFVHGIYTNPNSLLIIKVIFSGELGLEWTSGVLLIHFTFFIILFLLLKFGFKWTEFSK